MINIKNNKGPYTKKIHPMKRSIGFALIEILVYISVMVLLGGALVTTFLSLNTVLLRNKTERALAESASVSLERMVRTIRGAATIDLGQSTLNTSLGALAVSEGTTTTRFYISGGNLFISENGVDQGPLTSDNVIVNDVVFNRYIGSTTEMVRVALTLSAFSKASSSTRTFYTSAVLRGSYE